MKEALTQSPFPKSGRLWLIVVTVSMLTLHSLLVLQWSARQGRLALPVYYDDNHSLVDGGRRLEIWQHEGALAVIRDYIAHPPHAPGHSLTAMLSFALFGLHEWAPYLSNILFLGLVIYALHLALGNSDWRIKTGCIVLLLSTPIAGISILEFRSEVNVAALGTLGIILFMNWNLKSMSSHTLIASALCFAACFIFKPAVFPYTLGLMGLCAIFCLFLLFLKESPDSAFYSYLKTMILFFGTALLLPLPHYILDWQHITGYIQSIALSPSSLWLRHDDFLSGLQFHITGYPGRIMLGHLQKILLITIMIHITLQYKFKSLRRFHIASLIYFTIGAYIGVAINPMNQNYFGMTFHWLLLITALVSLAGILSIFSHSFLNFNCFVLGLISLVLFFVFKFPLSIDFYREKSNDNGEVFSWLQLAPKRVMDKMQENKRSQIKSNVLIAATSIVNGRTLEWLSIKDRMQFVFYDFFGGTIEEIAPIFQWADFIIVPEPHTPSLEYILPSARITSNIIDNLNQDRRFTLIEKLEGPHRGPGFCIYQKK